MKKLRDWILRNKVLAATIVGLPLFLCICVSFLIGLAQPSPPSESNVPRASEEAFQVAQNTSLPTETLSPTNTPIPTATNTPIPLAPNCQQIEQETRNLTDVQWDKYKKDFVGLWVESWEGEVGEVSKEFLGSHYNVHVRLEDDCTILVVVKDEDTALSYSIGDEVVVSGLTSGLADVLGKVIYLDDNNSSIAKK